MTFAISKEMKQRLSQVLIDSKHYNLKMKSDWINEAIVMLKENSDCIEMICNAEGKNDNFIIDKLYMTFYQRCRFAEMRTKVVKEYPDIKGPQAAIIRAAILNRMLLNK